MNRKYKSKICLRNKKFSKPFIEPATTMTMMVDKLTITRTLFRMDDSLAPTLSSTIKATTMAKAKKSG